MTSLETSPPVPSSSSTETTKPILSLSSQVDNFTVPMLPRNKGNNNDNVSVKPAVPTFSNAFLSPNEITSLLSAEDQVANNNTIILENLLSAFPSTNTSSIVRKYEPTLNSSVAKATPIISKENVDNETVAAETLPVEASIPIVQETVSAETLPVEASIPIVQEETAEIETATGETAVPIETIVQEETVAIETAAGETAVPIETIMQEETVAIATAASATSAIETLTVVTAVPIVDETIEQEETVAIETAAGETAVPIVDETIMQEETAEIETAAGETAVPIVDETIVQEETVAIATAAGEIEPLEASIPIEQEETVAIETAAGETAVPIETIMQEETVAIATAASATSAIETLTVVASVPIVDETIMQEETAEIETAAGETAVPIVDETIVQEETAATETLPVEAPISIVQEETAATRVIVKSRENQLDSDLTAFTPQKKRKLESFLITPDVKKLKQVTTDVEELDVDELIALNYDLDKMWEFAKRKVELEKEKSARNTIKNWTKSKKSLEAIITETMKEYGEEYERAMIIKYAFEEDKRAWEEKIRFMILDKARSSSSGQYSNRPYNFDSSEHSPKKRKNYEQEDVIPVNTSFKNDDPYAVVYKKAKHNCAAFDSNGRLLNPNSADNGLWHRNQWSDDYSKNEKELDFYEEEESFGGYDDIPSSSSSSRPPILQSKIDEIPVKKFKAFIPPSKKE